jgi:hypothetical protein
MTAPECLSALQLPEHAKGISNGSDIQGEGRRLVQAVECENWNAKTSIAADSVVSLPEGPRWMEDGTVSL